MHVFVFAFNVCLNTFFNFLLFVENALFPQVVCLSVCFDWRIQFSDLSGSFLSFFNILFIFRPVAFNFSLHSLVVHFASLSSCVVGQVFQHPPLPRFFRSRTHTHCSSFLVRQMRMKKKTFAAHFPAGKWFSDFWRPFSGSPSHIDLLLALLSYIYIEFFSSNPL